MKTYSLPGLELMEFEFSISQAKGEAYNEKNVLQCVIEKLESFAQLLENILHPDGGRYANLVESAALNDANRSTYFSLYKEFMHRIRAAQVIELGANKQAMGLKLAELTRFWSSKKTELLKFLNTLQNVWENDLESQANLEYLG